MPTLLSHLLSRPDTLGPGPTSGTVFTTSPIAPGGFILTRRDGAALRPADAKAAARAYELNRAFHDPTRTLIYADGAYLTAVQTTAPTRPEDLTYHRRTRTLLVPGPRGGRDRRITETYYLADTLTVTRTPLDYREPVLTTRTLAEVPEPAADNPAHPDNVASREQEFRQLAAKAAAERAAARRASRARRQAVTA